MTLTDREMAADLWCFDHPDSLAIEAPNEFSIAEIEQSRTRIASKRKIVGYYQETVRNEILSDADNLANRCRVAESDRNAAEYLYFEQVEINRQTRMVEQTVAWMAGALTMLGVLCALGHIA